MVAGYGLREETMWAADASQAVDSPFPEPQTRQGE